jgi:hypothetical protein
MQKKKLYKKPEIARVEMKAEDAVLTACKTNAPGPRNSRPCKNRGPKCQNRLPGS